MVLVGSTPAVPRKSIIWRHSIAGLMRCPVTAEITGSNPVGVAKLNAYSKNAQSPINMVIFYHIEVIGCKSLKKF